MDNPVGKALNYIDHFKEVVIIKKKTHNEFIRQLKDVNLNIEVLSKYENGRTKVKCRCGICQYEWNATPENLLSGKGCKKCHFKKLSNLKMKSQEEFKKEVFELNPNIEVVGEYSGRQNKVDCKCLIHNNMFSITAGHLLSGETSCQDCIKDKNHKSGLKSHKQFIKDLYQVSNEIEVIGEYLGARKRIDVRCSVCGQEWSPVAYSLLQGFGCPKCRMSKGEKRLSNI